MIIFKQEPNGVKVNSTELIFLGMDRPSGRAMKFDGKGYFHEFNMVVFLIYMNWDYSVDPYFD